MYKTLRRAVGSDELRHGMSFAFQPGRGDGLEVSMFKNWRQWVILGIAIFGFAGITSAAVSFSISIGSDNFYSSVGNYDYLPYSYSSYGYGYQPPRISFYDVMADYGTWVYVAPFGRVWQPYVGPTWRPYVLGH